MNDDVQDAVRQWRAKADVDWATVAILRRDAGAPKEAICFHCQQYVEKLLKALLTLHQIEAPRTHDLRRLIQLAQPLAPELGPLADQADGLSIHGAEARYPDDWREVPETEMTEMLALAERFAAILLPLLNANR